MQLAENFTLLCEGKDQNECLYYRFEYLINVSELDNSITHSDTK